MLLALIYGFARFALDLLLIQRDADQSLRLEVLALRHQLRVLERQVGRPRWRTSDRLLLAALSRHLPRPDWRAFLVTPETVLRWHRELVRWKWAFFTRRRQRQGRPGLASELQELVIRLARENPRWGYPPHRGRAAQTGLAVLLWNGPAHPPANWSAARAPAGPRFLGRLPTPACPATPGHRLLHGRDRLAGAAPRPLLHRDREPARPPRWLHPPPVGPLGGATGPQSGLDAAVGRPMPEVPPTRPGRQVSGRLRRRLPQRGHGDHSDPVPRSAGECLCRTLGGNHSRSTTC